MQKNLTPQAFTVLRGSSLEFGLQRAGICVAALWMQTMPAYSLWIFSPERMKLAVHYGDLFLGKSFRNPIIPC